MFLLSVIVAFSSFPSKKKGTNRLQEQTFSRTTAPLRSMALEVHSRWYRIFRSFLRKGQCGIHLTVFLSFRKRSNTKVKRKRVPTARFSSGRFHLCTLNKALSKVSRQRGRSPRPFRAWTCRRQAKTHHNVRGVTQKDMNWEGTLQKHTINIWKLFPEKFTWKELPFLSAAPRPGRTYGNSVRTG